MKHSAWLGYTQAPNLAEAAAKKLTLCIYIPAWMEVFVKTLELEPFPSAKGARLRRPMRSSNI
jgi:hypothetical protein